LGGIDERGVTVIELIVAAFLGGLVLIATLSLFRMQAAFALRAQADLAASGGAAWALHAALRDLALAGADPLRVGIRGITQGRADRVVVERDGDADGRVDHSSSERVVLAWSPSRGGRFLRQVGSQSMAIAARVESQGLQLRYFDGQGGELAAPLDDASLARVRRIALELEVEEREGPVESRARLRGAVALRLSGEAP
jgi:hypothetical protein